MTRRVAADARVTATKLRRTMSTWKGSGVGGAEEK
eukprot:CAMPEP_0174902720 /NCGR_PEP_ID=MMETSP0167-20121228/39482_1 /TAXON_ID=38298 /ORGANISM="Rhodella maculata, Strain CCMP736" /LENGTH=34 /DNA_ID= /DNA_START= /DNA_END= /DNA_ORIENTATION=